MKTIRLFGIIALAMASVMSGKAQNTKNLTLGTFSTSLDLNRITANTVNLTVTRYLFAGYNTICLPFSMSKDELVATVGDGVQIERMVKVEGNEISFLDCTTEGIEAGKPYLIYSPTAKNVSFKTNDMNNIQVNPIALKVGDITMVGEWKKISSTGYYGIPAKQETDLLQAMLVNTEGTKSFLPTRCSFTKDVPSENTPTIKHITSLNNETSIQTLIATDAQVDVYAVNGALIQRNIRMSKAMSSLPSGMYVARGQKFIVK